MDPDDRRQQILARAQTLFRERPYGEVSNTEIAAAAGVSRGLLNHYFGTKRELYLAALAEMLDVPPVPVPEYVAGASVRDRVCESVNGWLQLLEDDQETWLAALGTGGDPELEQVVDQAREGIVDHIIEVVGLGPLARSRPEVRGMLRGFSGMAEATSAEWLKRGRLTRHQVHEFLEETLVRLLEDVIPRVLDDPPP
ncbi:TetR/AcrR family transcriptional regulator [Nonomuraea cavernae]|uniref:TetR family transcriptional regulator n=1 Tax=Nonomuraea cavernae TaxID=2045107 RepID=A0A918DGN8_9ACTN|nr:TetR/AcrR family transcriptional regulator [Nonomuraea cavernae]MCA2184371.1 TetR/AcrR family transcriptional regulator [Nonomuraea cavernae]GGO63996.1 TetR family transcriptional regulator [Nonomuraea cavernae]